MTGRSKNVVTGQTILILGLSKGNLRRLKAGEPILLKTETHPAVPEGLEIFLFAGDTEQSMTRAFVEGGISLHPPTGNGQ